MRPSVSELLGDDPAAPSLIVDLATLADVLGCAASTVRRLQADGVIQKSAPGRYDLRQNVRRYLSHKLAVKPGTADKARRERAQADLTEAKAKALTGALVSADDVAREWTGILRDVRAGMLALPSRIRSRLPHLTPADALEIDAEIRNVLAALGGEE